MISDRALDAAVGRDIITPGQAAALRLLEGELASEPAPARDGESLRLVTGFADIFVTIGVVLFLGALAVIMGARTGSSPMYAGLAACAWLLAEFFTFKRRMALPSIVLLVVFVCAVFVLSAQIAAAVLPARPLGDTVIGTVLGIPPEVLPIGVGALVAAALAALHYIRFRVPITVAAGAAALCILAVAGTVALFPAIGERALDGVLLACGLGVFALAMWFDMSDPVRVTRRGDIAFWLHLLAAPLIVHPIIHGFLAVHGSNMTPRGALAVLWVFAILGGVAVIVDRRALLVSGLLYAGFAFGAVVRGFGLTGSDLVLPTVLLALGAFVLLLSAGWQLLRRAILRRLPRPLARRLPHPFLASAS